MLILFVGTVQFLSGPQHCYVPADVGPRSLKYGDRALSALYMHKLLLHLPLRANHRAHFLRLVMHEAI